MVASVGTTSSTAVDPVRRDRRASAARHGVWLHVDAAYAGAAAIVPELRGRCSTGMERADSIVFNPHKWLLTNFDCTAYFVRDPEALLRDFRLTPEYLRTAHDADVVNFRDWGIQLGRRFRALKLWFVIRSYGVEGLRAIIRRHVALARELAAWVDADAGLRADGAGAVRAGVLPLPARRACARRSWTRLNARLLAAVNAEPRVFLTHTRLGGRYAIRLVVGQRGDRAASTWRRRGR